MQDLKSGIEHLKQAKAHMSKANGIMSDHISKLKELEEENAGLRAKLEALIQSDDSYMKLPLDADGVPIRIGDVVYGNPGIAWTVVGLRTSKLGWKVEMDNMPFLCEPDDLTHTKPEPLESDVLDADGVPIEVGDTVYCDDDPEQLIVDSFDDPGCVYHTLAKSPNGILYTIEPSRLSHECPDSWEKLEEDAKKTVCDFALAPRGEDGYATCDGCRFYESKSCSQEMKLEILKRAKKLAGIEELEGGER